MPAKQPCMCGAEDCNDCHPENVRNGRFMEATRFCDVCQTFARAVCDSCEWCGMQVCAGCLDEHQATCGNGGETKGGAE